MPRPDVRIVVLYEDRAHDSFLRKLVKRLRLEPVRFEKCGDSTGVLRRLGLEVDARDGGRAEAERIALVVPALEIENWYVHLCFPASRPVDEGRDYKPSAEWRELAKDLGSASRRAMDAWKPAPDPADPPSIAAARVELGRVA